MIGQTNLTTFHPSRHIISKSLDRLSILRSVLHFQIEIMACDVCTELTLTEINRGEINYFLLYDVVYLTDVRFVNCIKLTNCTTCHNNCLLFGENIQAPKVVRAASIFFILAVDKLFF